MAEAIKKIDLHGLTIYQTEIAIEDALRQSWGVYIIRLIHGYHGGTALRDFIYKTYEKDPRILRLERISPGTTDLHLKEL